MTPKIVGCDTEDVLRARVRASPHGGAVRFPARTLSALRLAALAEEMLG